MKDKFSQNGTGKKEKHKAGETKEQAVTYGGQDGPSNGDPVSVGISF